MTPTEALNALVAEGRLDADPAQAAAAAELTRLHEALEGYEPRSGPFGLFASDPPMGAYLWGGVGTGKSLLMDLFLGGAPVAKDRRRRVHFHAFCQEAQRSITAWRRLGDPARRRAPNRARRAPLDDPIPHVAKGIAARAWLLCFDEFQVTDVADAMILSRLFGELWDRGTVVVATSNREPGDLYKEGLNRPLFLSFVDMLRDRCAVVRVDSGRDYRLDGLKGASVYHTPLNVETEAAMEAAWARASVGAEAGPDALDVNGRSVPLPLVAGGAVRAGFDELCRAALGPADYLALAERFAVVVLDGVPSLTPEDRNEAARFVALIDALYEHRCKLVVSAAAPPDELYRAGDGAFEFSRTASRLHEMQTEAYLAQPHRAGEGAG